MKKNLLMSKLMIAALTISLLAPVTSVQAFNAGWNNANGKWQYVESNGSLATGWKHNAGKWYYMEQDGTMKTGWKQLGSTWYYLNPSGDMATGWKSIGGKWYYFNTNGSMVTGWKQVGGKWYYMTKNGDMTTGWREISGELYYMDKSGAMLANTVIDGRTLGTNGAMVMSESTDPYSGPDRKAWTPSSSYTAKIGGLSSNMTKAQFDALSTEMPAEDFDDNAPLLYKIPQDRKLYHYGYVMDEGVNIDEYVKYLSTDVYDDGTKNTYFLQVIINNGKVEVFQDVIMYTIY